MMLRFTGSNADIALPQVEEIPIQGMPLWQKLREIFRGAPTFSLAFLTMAILCAIFAPLLAPFSPVATNPRVSPGMTVKLTPLTALTTPRRVKNAVFSSWTSSKGCTS
jgi:hypothetical protein